MDNKAVNKQIRALVQPYLKQIGFSRFTPRTAWRYRERKIDVINFQSFNSYLAESLGCTTYSFALNLGCYFTDIPSAYAQNPVREKDGNLLPEEYRCHFRRTLRKGLRQAEFRRRDIWYIDPEGDNLAQVIADAIHIIKTKAEPWFEKHENLDQVLSELQTGVEKDGGTFGYGANPSPVRHYYTGFIALALNKPSLARTHLRAALESGLYDSVAPRIRAELDRMRNQ